MRGRCAVQRVQRSPYLMFRPGTVLISVASAVIVVSAFAVAAKLAVEGLTSLSYTIHWRETVPLLVLAVAFVVNGSLNRRSIRSRRGPE